LADHKARLDNAESVLSKRTNRFVIILECVSNFSNKFGIFRTAEALGIQEVWVIQPDKQKLSKMSNGIEGVSKKSNQWLTVKTFKSTKDAIDAAHSEDR
jgi:tRNA G18 (ribose-2'-O)-methylase SpoU